MGSFHVFKSEFFKCHLPFITKYDEIGWSGYDLTITTINLLSDNIINTCNFDKSTHILLYDKVSRISKSSFVGYCKL